MDNVARLISVAATAAVGIVLTRTLPKEEIGTLTLALVAAALVEATSSVGLSRHLVQRDKMEDADICTAFWGDFGFGIAGGLLLAATTPLIAALYDVPRLMNLLWVLAISIPLTGLIKTQRSLAFRRMRFDVVAQSDVIAALGAALVAVVLLFAGAGIWAVIVREVARRMLMVLTLWWRVGWRPSLVFSRQSFRESFGFGSRLLGVEILRQLSANFDQLVIGRVFGAGPVGVYSRGQTLVLMPLQQITGVVSIVLFPSFSREKDDTALAKAYVDAAGMLMFIMVPLVAIMLALAEDAVVLVLGERWIAASVFLRILAPTIIWRAASELLRNVYNAKGRTDLSLRTTIIAQVLIVLGVGIGCFFGTRGVAYGHLIGCATGTLVEQFVAVRLIQIKWRVLGRNLAGSLLVGALVLGVGFGALELLDRGWLRLFAVASLIGTLYLLLSHFLSLAAWQQIRHSLRRPPSPPSP